MKRICLAILNIEIYILKVLNQPDSMEHLKHKGFLTKSCPPFRPIVSSICTYNYNLGQHVGSFFSSHTPSEYSTKDSFTFIEEIKSVSVADKFLISFGVTSLFTNNPLPEAIDIAISFWKHP